MVEASTLVGWLLVLLLGLLLGHWIGRSRAPDALAREREELIRRHSAEREQLVREREALLQRHGREREDLVREMARQREQMQGEKASAIEDARKTSVAASRRTLGGQMAEKVAPHLPDFPYDPTELRFLGTPVDYVVFRGLSRDKVEEIVFLEIKSGKSRLTTRERAVRDAIRGARISWDEYRADLAEPAGQAVQVNVEREP